MTLSNNATIGITGRFDNGTAKMLIAGELVVPSEQTMALEFLTPRTLPLGVDDDWAMQLDVAEGTTVTATDTGRTFRWNGVQWMQTPGSTRRAAPTPSPEIPLPLLLGGALLLSGVFLLPALLSG